MEPRSLTADRDEAPAAGAPPRATARLTLACASALHVIHDGFSDALYVLLPLWAQTFGLSLTQVGAVKTVYTGGMALSQVPSGILAEGWGERRLLAAGTALTALGFVLVALGAGDVLSLFVLLLAAGLGSGVQHPLSSALVSKAYETGPRRAALGTYNFAGDLGKIAVPAAVAAVAAARDWRLATAAYGVVGLAAALVLPAVLARLGVGGPAPSSARAARAPRGWGIQDAGAFRALAAIGMLDTATRTALLTFLPFVLLTKGLTVAGVGVALAVLFAGGAAGKFVCGIAAERIGIIRTVVLTEAATACGMVLAVRAPRAVALAVLLPLGVALNGTSSVLYATVADLVSAARCARAYALYYTLIVGASAAAPIFYGVVGDHTSAPTALGVAAAVCLVTVPLCLTLRPALARSR
jgi:MFS transporter, FSR family, fosmidomycin resistance protein